MSKFSQPVVLVIVCLTCFVILALPGFANTPHDGPLEYAHVPLANNPLSSAGQITFTPVATAFLPIVLRPAAPPAPTATNTPTATATDKPFEDVVIVRIEYNPPGLDAVGEYVDLRNNELFAVNMNNWTLRDEVNNVFLFPDFTLGASSTVRVWIRSGINDPSNLYWGRDSATWNNDGDTAILRNSAETEIDTCTYNGGGQTAIC